MELPSPTPDGGLGGALAWLAAPDLLSVDPLVRLAADHGALIAFAITPDGTIVRVRGSVPDAITHARGDTEGLNVFDLYADVPALLGAVARALRGERIQVRLEIDGALLDCYYEPVRDDAGEVIGLRGVAFPVSEAAAPEPAARTMIEAGIRSSQQRRVVRRLARGLIQVEIAERLFLSPKTVGEYLRRVCRHLGMGSTGELIAHAARNGWDRDAEDDVVDDDPTG